MMIDAHQTAASAATGLTLVVLGAQVDTMIVGLFGAFFVSIWLGGIDGYAKAISAVLFSALLGAYGSPVLADALSAQIPSLSNDTEPLRLLLALIISAIAPSTVPLLVVVVNNRVRSAR